MRKEAKAMEEAAAVLAGALPNMLPEVIHSLAIRNKVTDSLKLIPRILRSIRICSHHSSSLSSLSNLSRELKEASGKAKKIWLFVISLQELMSHNWRQMERSKMAFYGGGLVEIAIDHGSRFHFISFVTPGCRSRINLSYVF